MAIIGETPNERATRESIRDELDMKGRKLGEYVDQHTTVTDNHTTHDILSRQPKCCVKHIPLTQGFCAIVDYKNYDKLMKHKWFVLKRRYTNYAARHIFDETGKQKTIMMHNEILPPPAGLETDHINHNGLDNQEFNLRHCTKAQNQYNQKPRNGLSKYKGVTFEKRGIKHWKAQINKGPNHYHLGSFGTEVEAALAYDKKAIELFGEYACLNLRKPL